MAKIGVWDANWSKEVGKGTELGTQIDNAVGKLDGEENAARKRGREFDREEGFSGVQGLDKKKLWGDDFGRGYRDGRGTGEL